MALPQEINEGAWFELGSPGTLLQVGLGLRGSTFRSGLLCSPGYLQKRRHYLTQNSLKTSISGRGEE